MAYPLLQITKIAAVALPARACIVLDTSNRATMAGAANAAKFGGVCQAAAAAGTPARIAVAGIVEVVAAGPIAPGDELMIAGATGKVTPIGATAGVVFNIVGRAEEAAVADGDIINMLIAPSSIKM